MNRRGRSLGLPGPPRPMRVMIGSHLRCGPHALGVTAKWRVNPPVAWVSLGLTSLWGVLGLGVRTWLHRRRTGRSPLRHGAGPRGWLAVIGVTAALGAGPVAEVAFGANRLVHSFWLAGVGLSIAATDFALMLWSQASMGE